MPSHIGTFEIRRQIALRNSILPATQNPSAPLEVYTSPQVTEPYSPGSARHRALEQVYLARK